MSTTTSVSREETVNATETVVQPSVTSIADSAVMVPPKPWLLLMGHKNTLGVRQGIEEAMKVLVCDGGNL